MRIFKPGDSTFFERAFGALKEYREGKLNDFKVCTSDASIIRDVEKMAPYLQRFHTTKEKISPGFWSTWRVCLQNPEESAQAQFFLNAARKADQQVDQDENHHFIKCTSDQETIRAFYDRAWKHLGTERFFYTDDDEGICVHTPAARQNAWDAAFERNRELAERLRLYRSFPPKW